MRLFPWRDPPDSGSAEALAQSRARLAEDTERHIAPLRELRERNNVTELVARLTGQGRRGNGRSPAAG